MDSSIKANDITHSLFNAYTFSAYFLSASPPKQGDYISFVFNNPVKIKGTLLIKMRTKCFIAILLTAGNTVTPNMTFGEETVVYITDDSHQTQELGHFTADGRFFIRMEGKNIKKIRVEVHDNLTNPVILEQIAFTSW